MKTKKWRVSLTRETSLKINAEDASRVRAKSDEDHPQTAAEEDRLRRKAAREAAKVREIYEELVLKKKPDALVTIGKIETPPSPKVLTTIGSASNGTAKSEEKELAGISGD